jgi:hypothetical protein
VRGTFPMSVPFGGRDFDVSYACVDRRYIHDWILQTLSDWTEGRINLHLKVFPFPFVLPQKCEDDLGSGVKLV